MKLLEEVKRMQIRMKAKRANLLFVGVKIRADSEDVGFCETFRIYCQTRFKRKAKQDKKRSKKLEGSMDETDNM